ncbi:MAG: hypothetical protein ABSD71_00225 [Bacteroidales bacterium]|jgi:hypothetical protein
MTAKPEKQVRHEKLIEFLSQFSQYQSTDGKPLVDKVNKERKGTDLEKISINDINNAVVVFTDVLNIMSGSAGDVDLYKLLQAYLTVPEYRSKMNALAKEAHSFKYEKNK